LRVLAKELQAQGKLQLEQAFSDASVTGQKRGPRDRAYQAEPREEKIIALADDGCLAVAVSIESASPHESQLVEGVLGHSFLDTVPARRIGDQAYDSDPLDYGLTERYGIEMIAPHREVRRKRLLVPQRHHGIDFGRPPRRQIARGQRDAG